jgi:hypothetical protein
MFRRATEPPLGYRHNVRQRSGCGYRALAFVDGNGVVARCDTGSTAATTARVAAR